LDLKAQLVMTAQPVQLDQQAMMALMALMASMGLTVRMESTVPMAPMGWMASTAQAPTKLRSPMASWATKPHGCCLWLGLSATTGLMAPMARGAGIKSLGSVPTRLSSQEKLVVLFLIGVLAAAAFAGRK
jgi:hypothetical protein